MKAFGNLWRGTELLVIVFFVFHIQSTSYSNNSNKPLTVEIKKTRSGDLTTQPVKCEVVWHLDEKNKRTLEKFLKEEYQIDILQVIQITIPGTRFCTLVSNGRVLPLFLDQGSWVLYKFELSPHFGATRVITPSEKSITFSRLPYVVDLEVSWIFDFSELPNISIVTDVPDFQDYSKELKPDTSK